MLYPYQDLNITALALCFALSVCTRLNEWELLSVWLIYSNYPFHSSLFCLCPIQSPTAWRKHIFFLVAAGMPSPSFSFSSYHIFSAFEGLFLPPIYLLPRLKQLKPYCFSPTSYISNHWLWTTCISQQPSRKEEKCWVIRLSGKRLRERECQRPHKVTQNISSLKGNRLQKLLALNTLLPTLHCGERRSKSSSLTSWTVASRKKNLQSFSLSEGFPETLSLMWRQLGKLQKVQNELLTLCAISRGFPPLMRIPFCAATPVPTITAVGVAKPKEQGHAMLSTVIEVWNANLSISSAFERCLFWFCKKREKRGQKKNKRDIC